MRRLSPLRNATRAPKSSGFFLVPMHHKNEAPSPSLWGAGPRPFFAHAFVDFSCSPLSSTKPFEAFCRLFITGWGASTLKIIVSVPLLFQGLGWFGLPNSRDLCVCDRGPEPEMNHFPNRVQSEPMIGSTGQWLLSPTRMRCQRNSILVGGFRAKSATRYRPARECDTSYASCASGIIDGN